MSLCRCLALEWDSGATRPARFLFSIEGAADGEGATLDDVGVDHGGADALVAEEFLDGVDIVAGLEEVGGEGVAQGVA